MTDSLRFALSALLLGSGVLCMLIALLGVYRFDFVLNRMHCAGIIDTLGILLLLAGLAVACGSLEYLPKLGLILLLLWLSSPMTSHLVARMEVHTDETAEEYMKKEDRS